MTGKPGTSGPEQPVADPRDYVQDGLILIGCSKAGRDLTAECIELALANRHGLVTGATGTGKSVTLQALAHRFSAAGVPVFMADAKGVPSGSAKAAGASPKVSERLKSLATEVAFEACPVAFWDLYGKSGHPVRATVSDMGPLLLGRMLGLNETQEGVLGLVFKIADDEGRLPPAPTAP